MLPRKYSQLQLRSTPSNRRSLPSTTTGNYLQDTQPWGTSALASSSRNVGPRSTESGAPRPQVESGFHSSLSSVGRPLKRPRLHEATMGYAGGTAQLLLSQDTTMAHEQMESSPELDTEMYLAEEEREEQTPSASSYDGEKRPRAPNQKTFPHQLFKLLNDTASSAYIDWDTEGFGFIIPDQTIFTKMVLAHKTYFKTTSLPSFVRQCNNYGFHKLKEGESKKLAHFTHPSQWFQRGHPELLVLIKRNKSENELSNKASDRGEGASASKMRRPSEASCLSISQTPDPDVPSISELQKTVEGLESKLEAQGRFVRSLLQTLGPMANILRGFGFTIPAIPEYPMPPIATQDTNTDKTPRAQPIVLAGADVADPDSSQWFAPSQANSAALSLHSASHPTQGMDHGLSPLADGFQAQNGPHVGGSQRGDAWMGTNIEAELWTFPITDQQVSYIQVDHTSRMSPVHLSSIAPPTSHPINRGVDVLPRLDRPSDGSKERH